MAEPLVVVHGPSGCGRTTLLNLIGGLDRPDSGRVRACGTELTHASHAELTAFRARSVGFVFQFYNLLPTLTALENVEAGVRVAGVGREEARQRGIALLERVGRGELDGRFPEQLSGGEQQRVAIARALAKRPRLPLASGATGVLVDGSPAVARRLRAEPAVARVTSKASALSAERVLLDELIGLVSVLQAISLGVGALFLVSTLTLSYLDRRGEFATLAALGYGRRQIEAAVAGEALTQTLLAAALSIPLGVLIASPLSQRIAEAWFEIGLHPEAPSFLLVIGPALALALLAAAHATHRALRLNIAATVRARPIG